VAEKLHFCPIGAIRCTDSHEIWHGRQAHGSAWPAKFHLNRCTGGGYAAQKSLKMANPKVQQLSLFGRVAPQGQTPRLTSTSVRDFYAPNYRA